MGVFSCDPDGLSAFAFECDQHALALRPDAAPTVADGSGQATIGAVSALHSDASALSAKMSTRVSETAAAIRSAARNYTNTENNAAEALGGSTGCCGG